MTAQSQPLTFISYSRADSQFALELAKELRSSGFNIWLDQLDIPTGSRWDDEVEKALLQCDIFMVILTPRSIASNNVKDEIGYAIDSNKRIMPVLLENATVPFRLRRFQYVDFTGKSYDEGIESAKELLRNLTCKLTATADSVPVPVGTGVEGVRILPKRLIDQQMQQGQAPPIHRGNQISQPRPKPVPPQDQSVKSKSKSSWTGNVVPILMGLALLFMVCAVAVWMALPYLPGRGAGSNIIYVTTVPPMPPSGTPKPTMAPMVQPKTTTAPTLRPTDTARPANTATSTFTPLPTITATSQVHPVDFIVGYFNAVIYDRDYSRGWSMLTPDFQVNKSKGWDNYVKFWGNVRSWEYSNIEVDYNYPPRTRVLITYTLYYYDGTAPSHLNGVHYCLIQADIPESWQIDIRENCP